MSLIGPPMMARAANTAESILVPDVAVIRFPSETVYIEDIVSTSVDEPVLGTLRAGLIEVVAVRPVRIEVESTLLRIETGVVQVTAADDGFRVCVQIGEVEVVDRASIAEGQCADIEPVGDWTPAQMADMDSTSELGWTTLTMPRVGIAFDDDPWAFLQQWEAAVQSGSSAGDIGSDSVETSGTAACLDTAGGGGEVTGPEGPELPETEIDRTNHQINLTVTLEGM